MRGAFVWSWHKRELRRMHLVRLRTSAKGRIFGLQTQWGTLIVLIMTAWLMAGVSLAPLLRDPHRARIVNTALAAAVVGATALAVLR